jgi:chemotaxis signal transduction protein
MMTSEITLSNVSHGDSRLVVPSNRYILAKVGDRTITFPDLLVSEIIIIDRSAILALPFYSPAIVGVIHKQAQVIPLLLLQLLLEERSAMIKESLTVIRLSKFADNLHEQPLSGVGIIVDRVVGSLTKEEYQDDISRSSIQGDRAEKNMDPKKINQTVANIKQTEYTPIEIILSSIFTQIWQPQRWQPQS